MKKNLLLKAVAALSMIALALVITVTPGIALATITSVTIVPDAGESYSLNVGDVVHLNANVDGVVDGAMVYAWTPTASSNISNSDPTLDKTTITGLKPSTSTVVTLTAYDDNNTSVKYKPTVTIKVAAMTINKSTLSLTGGATYALSVNHTSSLSTTVWESDNLNVATVDPATGEVTAVGGGTATITVTNTPDDSNAKVQTKTCKVTVSPIITIDPTSQNIVSASTDATVTLTVEYGGDLISDASKVSWSNSNSTAGSLTIKPTTFTDLGGGVLQCEATFRSNSTGVNASSNVTATIDGAGDYTKSKTAVVNVRTARYLTVEGDNTLNKTDRYGTYTVTLHEPDGSVVDNDSSTAHWSWSSSYLSLSSASLNDSRADMEDGVATIQLYARYNTPSSGTRLYAWLDDASSSRVYTTINITGLSSLPQTGQDMTLIYILGGAAVALLAAAGVWYGIRKKQTAA